MSRRLITIDRYRDFDPEARERFDAWLEAEGLPRASCRRIEEVGEGVVLVTYILRGPDGQPIVEDHGDHRDVATETRRFPVTSPPPDG